MNKGLILFITSFTLFLFSCQKEADLTGIPVTGTSGSGGSNGSQTDIVGTWRFVNFQAKTLATNEVSDGGNNLKTITTSDYTTEKNSGNIVFTASSITYENLAYSINTIAHATMYENGNILDTISFPIQSTIPPIKGQVTFKRISADSLYLEGGGFMMEGISQTSKAGGVRIKIEQDKLYFIQKVAETVTKTVQGQTVKSTQQAEGISTFQKQ